MKLGRLLVVLVACVGLMGGCGKSDTSKKKSGEVENVVQDMNIPKTPENSGGESHQK